MHPPGGAYLARFQTLRTAVPVRSVPGNGSGRLTAVIPHRQHHHGHARLGLQRNGGTRPELSVQQRVTSIQLRRPPATPVIAFAGGEHKAKAVLGALRGRWISGLITDETCARAILAAG